MFMPHVMELLGRARAVVRDGKVVEVGEPVAEFCPVFRKIAGVERLTREAARANLEERIRELGMFTPKRRFDAGDFVSFGATEIMMTALRRGLLDATVTVCEGAGSVITSDPQLVQGMGAQMSGLIETEPIPEIIRAIEERGGVVLDPRAASIDQVRSLERAVELGYRRIAVSLVDAGTARRLREVERETGVEAVLIGAHLTGVSRMEARELLELLDIVTGCASRLLREEVKPLLQVGASVPLFALTQIGKELLLERAKEVPSTILVNTMRLPVLPAHKQPRLKSDMQAEKQ